MHFYVCIKAFKSPKSFEIEGKPELSWKPFEQVEVVNTKCHYNKINKWNRKENFPT